VFSIPYLSSIQLGNKINQIESCLLLFGGEWGGNFEVLLMFTYCRYKGGEIVWRYNVALADESLER
jgi:hypothetical protein